MLRLNNVFFSYKSRKPKENVASLKIDLTIKQGDIVAIMGPSGSGKSTLLQLIAGLLKVESGLILIDGKDITYTLPNKRPLSIVLQENNLFPHINVFNNIALGLKPKLRLSTLESKQVYQAAQTLGVSDLLNRFPHSLSGGQKQRIALARAFVRNTPLLLLDEPLSALDMPTRRNLLQYIQLFNHLNKTTVVMVTHSEDDALAIANHRVYIENGMIEENKQ